MKDEQNIAALYSLVQRFRWWSRDWDLYSAKQTMERPKSLDELLEELSEEYFVLHFEDIKKQVEE